MKAGRPSEIIRSFRSGKITTLNCEGCHRCCGAGVALSDKEARTHPLKFYASKYANDRPRLCDRGDGYCGLLTKEGLCGAYDKRPKPCREYDCRVVALRNLVLKRMGEDIKHEGAVRPDWEFELETDEDRAVLDTFEQLFRDKPELKDQYPIGVVRRYWPDSTYNAILYGATRTA